MKRQLWYRASGDFRYGDIVGTSPSWRAPGRYCTTQSMRSGSQLSHVAQTLATEQFSRP